MCNIFDVSKFRIRTEKCDSKRKEMNRQWEYIVVTVAASWQSVRFDSNMKIRQKMSLLIFYETRIPLVLPAKPRKMFYDIWVIIVLTGKH